MPRRVSPAISDVRRALRLGTLLTLLVWPALGWTQTPLRTPAADPPPCIDKDCPTGPGKNDTSTRSDENSAGIRKRGSRDVDDPEDERGGNGERERNGQRRSLKTEALPEAPPSEFQEFIAGSVGRTLPLFGHDLFDAVPTTFAPVERIPVTDDYRLGPGDEILLRAWGQIDLNARLIVDRGGEVFLPKVGTLSVTGLRYQQLPDFFRSAIGRA